MLTPLPKPLEGIFKKRAELLEKPQWDTQDVYHLLNREQRRLVDRKVRRGKPLPIAMLESGFYNFGQKNPNHKNDEGPTGAEDSADKEGRQ